MPASLKAQERAWRDSALGAGREEQGVRGKVRWCGGLAWLLPGQQDPGLPHRARAVRSFRRTSRRLSPDANSRHKRHMLTLASARARLQGGQGREIRKRLPRKGARFQRRQPSPCMGDAWQTW